MLLAIRRMLGMEFWLLFCFLGLSGESVWAWQEAPASTPSVDPSSYEVPQTTDIGTLEQFIDALLRLRPKNGEEYQQHITHMPPAVDAAARKIMEISGNPEDLSFQKAAYMTVVARIFALKQLEDDEVKVLLDEIDTRLQTPASAEEAAGLAAQVAERLEDANRIELAEEAYTRFGPQLAASSFPDVASHGKRMLGAAQRLNLLGSGLEIEGQLTNGQAFDWSSYRGKVVYVDYWASWSGPCLADLPALIRLRHRYGTQGFEIVGICLDKDLERTQDAMAENGVDWPCLFKQDAGWNHPMVLKYGISKIPSSFLVDQEGKVIAFNLRHEALEQELAKLFAESSSPSGSESTPTNN